MNPDNRCRFLFPETPKPATNVSVARDVATRFQKIADQSELEATEAYSEMEASYKALNNLVYLAPSIKITEDSELAMDAAPQSVEVDDLKARTKEDSKLVRDAALQAAEARCNILKTRREQEDSKLAMDLALQAAEVRCSAASLKSRMKKLAAEEAKSWAEKAKAHADKIQGQNSEKKDDMTAG